MPSRDDTLCRRVCRLCEMSLSKRHSALCWNQCDKSGRAYDACVTVSILTEQIEVDDLDL